MNLVVAYLRLKNRCLFQDSNHFSPSYMTKSSHVWTNPTIIKFIFDISGGHTLLKCVLWRNQGIVIFASLQCMAAASMVKLCSLYKSVRSV